MALRMVAITFLVLSFSSALSNSISSRADPSSIFFELFTNANPKVPQILRLGDVAALSQSNYRRGFPTKMYVHGWTSDAGAGHPAKDEMLKKYPDCNYISVDWSELAKPLNYPLVVRDNVHVAGQHVAQFIQFLIDQTGTSPDLFHLFGHSLGAHVSGEAGQTLKGVLPRITGIDPAGPFFSLDETDNRLDISDAQFVDIIHTDSGKLTGNELGFYEPIGHVDFYPNGGKDQPGCISPGKNLPQEKNACDHERGPRFWTESINTQSGFWAKECLSMAEMEAKECTGTGREQMGEPTPSTARGIYFLTTNRIQPYAQGLI